MTTNTPILIGITGRLGTGKTRLAGYLADQIPGTRVVALADALKEAVLDLCCDAVPWKRESMREWLEGRKGSIYGPLLQGWGEFIRETYGRNTWIEALEQHLPHRAIVADVRYPNEADWIRSRGGILVAVSGPCRREGDQRSTDHPSEAHVEQLAAGAGWRIENTGSLPDLHAQASRLAAFALRTASVQP